jgi:hypothetical protein
MKFYEVQSDERGKWLVYGARSSDEPNIDPGFNSFNR